MTLDYGALRALADVSFAIERGSILCLPGAVKPWANCSTCWYIVRGSDDTCWSISTGLPSGSTTTKFAGPVLLWIDAARIHYRGTVIVGKDLLEV